MQTIKITITSSSPIDIAIKECTLSEKDVTEKIAELLKKSNTKEEAIKDE
jgi:hypothetical protein